MNASQKTAIPATISLDQIRGEGLAQEMGIFIASGLAKSHRTEGKIGLTLRLILWMADQVYRYDKGKPTAGNFGGIRGENK